jgi:hypothetical protein
MVLDDVLVNFDVQRAQRAAEVLCEFAAGGHQLLLFTCHEHIWEMFKKLEADCRRLPARRGIEAPGSAGESSEPAKTTVVEKAPARKRAKKKPRRRRAPKPVAEEPLDLYNYPFVERIIEEPVPTTASTSSEFHEYSFDLPAVEYDMTPRRAESALAFIVSADAELDRRSAKSQPSWRAVPYGRGDHLEPRRA